MTGRRRFTLLGIGLAFGLAVAIPVFAADPSSAPTPPGHSKPDKSPKPGKGNQKAHTPEVDVTVTGTVQQGTDGQGRPSFTLTADGKTWDLSAGPPWYWGDANPLKAYAGKSVTIAGSSETGSSELDVATVDGKAIRADGKPAWAGGPWRVGQHHPGWKSWMSDGKPGRGLGRDHAPGQQKDKSGSKDEPAASPGS